MKVKIDYDERYPDYILIHDCSDKHGTYIDVPEKTIKRWERIAKSYNKMHSEIKAEIAKAYPS